MPPQLSRSLLCALPEGQGSVGHFVCLLGGLPTQSGVPARLQTKYATVLNQAHRDCSCGLEDRTAEHTLQRCLLLQKAKDPVQLRTQSNDPISCYGKPAERTNETAYLLTSSVNCTGSL